METCLNTTIEQILTPHMALTVLRIVERFKSHKDRVEHHNWMSSDVKLHKKVAPQLAGGSLMF
jgi:hypothetical protein